MNFPLPETEGEGMQPVDIEDRAAPRFTLLIRPAKLHVGESQFVCIIRDISATGVSLRLFHDIEWKGPITLELQTGDRHSLEFVWNRATEVGLQFMDQVEVDNIIGHCSLYPKRDLRFDIAMPITFQSGGVAYTASIANLSRQGALLECDSKLAVSQPIMLEARGFPTIEARVRWRRGNQFGLVFDTTFSLAELAVLIERLQAEGFRTSPGQVSTPAGPTPS
uniref:PilZ domain-containing protein n=1 Tax=Parerythrobacter lutipelagi TaxID=1964208 RepID=UPI0013756FAC|nr:PilZ domain-containing protein [Parerythrobacter lutipelagi]